MKTACNWTPPPGRSNNLDSYIHKVEKELDVLVHDLNTTTIKLLDNLSSNQRRALYELKGNNNIVIKPADKGGSTVIMDKDNYIREACTQLHDERFLKKIDNIPTPTLTNKIETPHQRTTTQLEKWYFETSSPPFSSRNILRYPENPLTCQPSGIYFFMFQSWKLHYRSQTIQR